MTDKAAKLTWHIPNNDSVMAVVKIPYLNPEMNESLVYEGYTWNKDAIDDETTKTINEYLEQHLCTDQNFMFVKLKWDLDIEEWHWSYNAQDGFELELYFDYIGKDDDYEEKIDQAMAWLTSEHTMDITREWDSHGQVQDEINSIWMDNWVSCEDPWYCIKLLQNDILITEGVDEGVADKDTTQAEVQTHIDQTWLTCYSTDDYASDQKDLIDYCKDRWGYTITIPQKAVA